MSMDKSDLFVFCTAAEKNAEVYMERVRKWYSMMEPLYGKADFFCAIDGKLPDEAWKFHGVEFCEYTPALGRSGVCKFEGWKRSYGKMLAMALERGYKYIFHCENDVVIRNWERVLYYVRKPGLYSSWCTQYNFIEAAFQILNDPENIMPLMKHYMNGKGICEDVLFEHVLQLLPFEYTLTSARIEGRLIDTKDLDFTAQSY